MGRSIEIAVTSFEADAHAWFDWLGSQIAGGHRNLVLPMVGLATWHNPSGHSWRIMRTADGIEIRPGLESPFIHFGESPKVTALAIQESTVVVELACRTGRWVDRFPLDAFDIAALGHAMLDEKSLPHDNLARLFPLRNA